MSKPPITAKDIEILRQTYSPNTIGRGHIYRLLDEIERLNAERERFDTILVKSLILPGWGDVEDDLVKTYRDVKASDYESLQAVYGDILEMLALNLVLARAALAGDDADSQEPNEATDEYGLIDPFAFTRLHQPEPKPVEQPLVYPEPGSDIPGMPGYRVGTCGHRVAGSEWRAGFRTCERCPSIENQP